MDGVRGEGNLQVTADCVVFAPLQGLGAASGTVGASRVGGQEER